mmetsp:Transcript_14914/g.62063  ORF Transcript_14914/g.62063 Transcript_14914/m.62063 type:complete len:303 (+) Transcript_14914:3-911(+)
MSPYILHTVGARGCQARARHVGPRTPHRRGRPALSRQRALPSAFCSATSAASSSARSARKAASIRLRRSPVAEPALRSCSSALYTATSCVPTGSICCSTSGSCVRKYQSQSRTTASPLASGAHDGWRPPRRVARGPATGLARSCSARSKAPLAPLPSRRVAPEPSTRCSEPSATVRCFLSSAAAAAERSRARARSALPSLGWGRSLPTTSPARACEPHTSMSAPPRGAFPPALSTNASSGLPYASALKTPTATPAASRSVAVPLWSEGASTSASTPGASLSSSSVTPPAATSAASSTGRRIV